MIAVLPARPLCCSSHMSLPSQCCSPSPICTSIVHPCVPRVRLALFVCRRPNRSSGRDLWDSGASFGRYNGVGMPRRYLSHRVGGEEVGSVAHGLEAAHAAKSVGALAREHEEERAGLHRR